MNTDKKQNSVKLKNLNWLLAIALFLLLIVLSVYIYNFNDGISHNKNDWGVFGDFIGGTLNPLFAFLSLFAIIYTIRIQTQELEFSRKELEFTRDELEKSRVAQEEQSESFKIQNESIKKQTFENTFFQLISSFVNTKNNITINIEMDFDSSSITSLNDGAYYIINNLEGQKLKLGFMNNKELHSYEAIKMYLQILKLSALKNISQHYDQFNKNYEGYTSTYFGQIYQILKFIDNSDIPNKQSYINLFRAQFTKEELEFLFYHCLGQIGSRKFKHLVEEFQFFEHISLNNEIKKNITNYKIKAFGNNEIIKKLFDTQS